MILDEYPEFIPKWTTIMRDCFQSGKFDFDLYRAMTHDNHLDMGEFGTCMVGEAHGFNDLYKKGDKDQRCTKCIDLSLNACFLKNNNIDSFNTFKNKLHAHMVSKH